jgi:hypothetical protein
MALFENVHRLQLLDAYCNLQKMHPGAYWRIALRERLLLRLEPDIATETMDQVIYVIDVRLGRHGKLEITDDCSQRVLDDWEKRNFDLVSEMFDAPDLSPPGDHDAISRD